VLLLEHLLVVVLAERAEGCAVSRNAEGSTVSAFACNFGTLSE
jgi:hypothetical protein